ncbi:hypothetical protein IX39_20340 [Chryseobacterium formosense]|uniref:Uncharacterized protein n=1 Tax=Chryseobacterium formosense TaxID=236814 RepID=A0A085YYT4_9FLAO|nr:hypothetical protein IX39_20340 [Chryseobacterium formosense]SFT91290.1 hypothetical protein SAMN05421857_4081 [Chryseobacterium formosense]
MFVVISAKTYQSQWVPFEVGYGHAAILDKNHTQNKENKIRLGILTLHKIFLKKHYPIICKSDIKLEEQNLSINIYLKFLIRPKAR